jgi:hypothetical protein
LSFCKTWLFFTQIFLLLGLTLSLNFLVFNILRLVHVCLHELLGNINVAWHFSRYFSLIFVKYLQPSKISCT